MQLFINAQLILENSILFDAYLLEADGLISAFGKQPIPPSINCCDAKIIDCKNLYLSPGFIDIHTHGSGGYDYMDGTFSSFIGAAKAHLRFGATTILPTTLASSDEDLFQTIDIFRQVNKQPIEMPHMPGLHLEGPYFCPEQKGAMESRYLKIPRDDHYHRIVDYAQGAIKRWSLAPELPGALEMVDALLSSGIKFSAGHTNATYEQMSEAFDHGITHLTHFYSAMSTITRKDGFRVLGVVESGYLINGLTLEIIADGMHLPPALLCLIFQSKAHDQICSCTDSMRAAGMGPGPSILGPINGGQEVVVEEGIAKMPDRSCFAGSVATCDRLVRTLMEHVGLSLWEAVRSASLLPARFMGLEAQTGSIALGKQADLLVFDDRINIYHIYVSGNEVATTL
jgi:N-acetylglucosamine-6-phosphate deacetylase